VKFPSSLALAAALACAAPLMAQAQQKVRLATSVGDIVVEVDAEKAPKTADNFLRYVKAGHYDGVIFHRVIENFMIQTGGYKPDLSEKPPRAPIPLEVGRGLSNVRGSLAMARTDNPNSATSQFFINVADNPRLDDAGGGYAVFGKVVDGMDVVDQIRAVPTRAAGVHGNLPQKTILIKKASLEK
jgi:peptidyl-prolyl cis-trans isomerase A (cyclophilin A)